MPERIHALLRAADDGGRFRAERAGNFDVAGLERGHEADDEGDEEADGGVEQHHAPVHLAREKHGDAGARGQQEHEGVAAKESDEQSAGGADNGKQQSFGEELTEQADAAGADGETKSHLVAAAEGSNEEKIGDVGACDEKDKGHDDNHDFERREQRPRVVEGRLPERPEAQAAAAIGGGVVGGKARGDSGNFLLSLGARDARLETHIGFSPARAVVFEFVAAGFESLLHRGGNPELHRPADEGSVEAWRGDSDDCVRDVVEALHFSDDVWIGVETAVPELIADHDHRMGVAAGIVAGLEGAPEGRANTNGLEVIGGDDAADRGFRACADVESAGGDFADEEAVALCAVLAQSLKVRPGNLGRTSFAAGGSSEGDEALLVDDGGVRAEENAFEPAENRSVRADAQNEAENGEGGESRIAQELAKPEAQILSEVFRGVEAVRLSALFLDLSDAADGAKSLSVCLLRRHAGGEAGGDLLFDMVAQLVVDFLVDLLAAKQREPAEAKGIEPGHSQASVRFTMAEMASERRFQAAASFPSCVRPSRVRE